MSIQIFSPLTANKNSSKVITAADGETGGRREERGTEEEEGTWKLWLYSEPRYGRRTTRKVSATRDENGMTEVRPEGLEVRKKRKERKGGWREDKG